MAKNHKLGFRIVEGTISDDEIKKELRKKGFRVRKVSLRSCGERGSITFQKKEDKEACKALSTIELGGVTLELETPANTVSASATIQTTSGTNREDDATPAEHLQLQPNDPFFNPYHFVNVEGYVPRYAVTHHDRFCGHCGKIDVEIEFIRPFFIPDPEKTTYIISDETLKEENESPYPLPSVSEVISNWMQVKELNDESLPLQIYFDPDCNRWDPENPQNHIWGRAESGIPVDSVYPGVLCRSGDKYYITTNTPLKWAHKQMAFFKLNGQYAIPATSIRGMLRSTIEILSNSCFSNVHAKESKEYVFRRLNVSNTQQRDEAMRLQPVILKKVNGRWRYFKLNQAKILSPHMLNRVGHHGDNSLGAYWHRSGYYEKISVIGKDSHNARDCTGLHLYDIRKHHRGEIHPITSMFDVETTDHSVTKINGVPLNHAQNRYNKTFPYVGGVPPQERYWAIIRERTIQTPRGGTYQIYKIKKISSDLTSLENQINTYRTSALASERPDVCNSVRYTISEIRIKTSFDIDTKTQYRAFFIFGEKNFDNAIANAQFQGFGQDEDRIIEQFRSLLRQRKQNAKKLSNDRQGLNRWVRENLPDDIYDGMLAYYHPDRRYLTYTAVPQKPYKYGPENIMLDIGKAPCDNLELLCPACNMFGTTPPRTGEPTRQATGYRGKVTVSMGRLSTGLTGQPRYVSIKPLSTPKPTYYPFYLIENRKPLATERGYFVDYDNDNISIGRKVYLHHPKNSRGFTDSSKTNLNSTIQPLPPGVKFRFRIDFENLSTYELGLLLYSLNMRYKENELPYHLGMGKPLGLGSCRLRTEKVLLFDPCARYMSLDDPACRELTDEQINLLKLAYKYVQISDNIDEFNRRKDKINLDVVGISTFQFPPNTEDLYYNLLYIKEFHILKSLNVSHRIEPICYAGGASEGFRWYQEAKKHPAQALFDPSSLDRDLESNQSVTNHALRAY